MSDDPFLIQIAPGQIHEYWTRMVPYLNRVIERGNCDNSLADIQHYLMTGNMQAWHDRDWRFLIVTQPQTFGINPQIPTKRTLLILFGAGEGVEDWADDAVNYLSGWAQQVYGISSLRLVGRPGWARFLKDKGFKVTSVILEKNNG